jgi:hypothetical protein
VLQADPDNLTALGGLVRCFVALGELQQARGPPGRAFRGGGERTPPSPAPAPRWSSRNRPKALGPARPISAGGWSATRNDHQTRFDLAVALNARGDPDGGRGAAFGDRPGATAAGTTRLRASSSSSSSSWGSKDPAAVKGRQRLSISAFRLSSRWGRWKRTAGVAVLAGNRRSEGADDLPDRIRSSRCRARCFCRGGNCPSTSSTPATSPWSTRRYPGRG